VGFWTGLLWFIYIVVCLFLWLIILIQRGETGGLASAFGGGGGDTAFGVKADTTWKRATAYFAGTFMFLGLLLTQLLGGGGGSVVTPPKPAATATEDAKDPNKVAPPANGDVAPPANGEIAPPATPPGPGAPPAGNGTVLPPETPQPAGGAPAPTPVENPPPPPASAAPAAPAAAPAGGS